VDANHETPWTAGNTPAKGGRIRPIAMIVIFDVAAPFAAYSILRSAGMTAVTALLLSGVFPVLGVTIGAIRNHRLDVVGVLVLAGIAVGTVLGLVSHNARLLLVEGSVPTVIFGVACLGSLWTRHPLMFSFALEFTGPDTAKGREMTTLWQYDGFRQVFRVITVVWGIGFLVEAALRVVIVYSTSTGTALASSKVTPFLWAGILSAWTVAYGTRQRKKGERLAAAAATAAVGEAPGTGHVPPSAETTKATDLA
jgi:intracellular septation protein A